MKKVLMLASVASMIDQFNRSNLDILIDMGYEVHVAANFINGNTSSNKRTNDFKRELLELGVIYHQIDFSRKITNIGLNIRAYKQIKSLMKENNYDFIHCHSPIGGVCGRIAGYKTKTPVMYTAHGFHFHKGAPLKNWLLFYPVERQLAKLTDILITINNEDQKLSRKFKAKEVAYVPGIGIDSEKFEKIVVDKESIRQELGIPPETTVLLSIGEMIKRKNHETAIRALAKLNKEEFIYLICGKGELESYLKEIVISLGLENKVKFLGFRKDIPEICLASDVFLFPSFQEGLPVSVMEAMSAGLPVVCSSIRGNTDLITNGVGGYLVEPNNINGFKENISKLIDRNNSSLIKKMGAINIKEVKKYDKKVVIVKMQSLYKKIASGDLEKTYKN
ncbi:glycosyltransferase family 4 protein [Guptibacillus hwajinpoensis]|uniref:glycosyltransferase family 4 protein n=1 Tax=Guptibacillus hwajinpoensis TaxID=208199 RepID=UPI003CFED285